MEGTDRWRRPFLALYLGQAASLLSSSAVQFAIIWWITLKTGSAVALTAASVAGLLPQALLGPFAGVFIDRHDRKAVMAAADLGVAASSWALVGRLSFVATRSHDRSMELPAADRPS